MTPIERRELMIDTMVTATADMNADPPYSMIIPLNVIHGARIGRVVHLHRRKEGSNTA